MLTATRAPFGQRSNGADRPWPTRSRSMGESYPASPTRLSRRRAASSSGSAQRAPGRRPIRSTGPDTDTAATTAPSRGADRGGHAGHTRLALGDALRPAAAADLDPSSSTRSAARGRLRPTRRRAPSPRSRRPSTRGRRPARCRAARSPAPRRPRRRAPWGRAVAAVELDALAGEVAQPGQDVLGGREQRVAVTVGELAERGAGTPATVGLAHQQAVRLEAHREPVRRRARQPGALAELAERAGRRRGRPEDDHRLVEHADTATLSHRTTS